MGSEPWQKFRLGDVCKKIGSGATPRGGADVYLASGDIAFIRSQNVYNERFHHDGLVYLTDDHATQLANVEVEDLDVLLNITGDSVARCCQVDSAVLPARVNQHVAIIRADSDALDPTFLRYALVTPAMQARMRSWAGAGGTRNALTKAMIESFEIDAPVDIEEQRAIAGLLGALDDKIELNRRRGVTLEGMGRALFEEWFVGFGPTRAKAAGRLPPGLPPSAAALFPAALEPSEAGDVPKGWRLGTFGDVAEERRRSVAATDIGADTPYIALEHMPRRRIALDAWATADGVASGKLRFRRREVLFGKLRPYFHKVGVAPLDGVCSTDIVVLGPREAEYDAFVLMAASGDEFVAYTDRTSAGTKMPRTNWRDIAAFPLVIPPPPVAAAFTAAVSPMVERILKNGEDSAALAALRDALLPKLISGELRVPAAEEMAVARNLETP